MKEDPQPSLEQLEQLHQLLKDMPPFEPVQYYIESLDWMIIQTRDCCVVDEHINEWFDLMYDGHTGDEKGENMELVGVKIKGYNCLKNNWPVKP